MASAACVLVVSSVTLACEEHAAAGASSGGGTVATIDADGVQRVRIVGGSYFFKPARVIVKKGVPVELTLVKEEGLTPHNFVLQGGGVSIERELTTRPVTVSFTAAVAGKSAFYCSNKLPFGKSHRERGMEGVLEVVD